MDPISRHIFLRLVFPAKPAHPSDYMNWILTKDQDKLTDSVKLLVSIGLATLNENAVLELYSIAQSAASRLLLNG